MAQPVVELEGTWEEIAARAADFAGHRVRLTVYPANERGTLTPEDARLRVLREIEERSRDMNPTPDAPDLLREGRAGAMFGGTPLISGMRGQAR